MAILGFLNTSADDPRVAIVHDLTANVELAFSDGQLSPDHVELSALPDSEEHDGAWAWQLTADAPGVQDGGVTTVNADGTAAGHPGVESGVVVYFEDYMGYVVIVDTDNEDPEALIDYAVGQLEFPAGA